MAVVMFAGLTFDGASAAPGFGLARLVGWYDAAPVRSETRVRPASDGFFGVDRVYRNGRVITVSGRWVGESVAEAYAAREALAAVQPGGIPSLFSVTDPLGVRSCIVRLASAPTVDDGIYLPHFGYSFDVIADDPRKYGPELAPTTGLPVAGTGAPWPSVWTPGYDWGSGGSPGRVDAFNAGTATTYPILEVTGGLSEGVELVEIITGSYLRLERPIPTTSVVVFDTRTGAAYVDVVSNDVTGLLVRRDWEGFAIPGGSTRTIQFNGLGTASGTPQLTVRYSPAY